MENFSTTTGQPTNAVYGFTSMLINILRDEQPTHLAVAFDVGRKTFRSEIFAEYKANRSESPTDFRGQVSLVQEVLGALRVPVITAENYEADDVIATLTVQAVEQGMDVLIATGDRDALQLVNPHVTVLYPRKGVSDMTRFTPEAVEAMVAACGPDRCIPSGSPASSRKADSTNSRSTPVASRARASDGPVSPEYTMVPPPATSSCTRMA